MRSRSAVRVLAAGGIAALLVGVTACQSSSPTVAPTTGPTATCAVSAKLVPACGVLWGVATAPDSYEAVQQLERRLGRPFNLVYHYHDIVAELPTADERRQVNDGKILHLAIAARIYGQDQQVTYADIANGKYDAQLRAQGAGIASLKTPVFVTFEQEGNQRRKLDVRGDATQYKAAWRHIHDIYTQAGATNAVWVWVMTGEPGNLARAADIWPGNAFVDWISWNVYNQSGCHSDKVTTDAYASFETRLRPFYDWIHTKGPGLGIDPTKPMMISETGSVTYAGNPHLTAGWYAQIPAALKNLPQIKAVQLWDSKTSAACDYRFERSPQVMQAVSVISRDKYLDSVPIVPKNP